MDLGVTNSGSSTGLATWVTGLVASTTHVDKDPTQVDNRAPPISRVNEAKNLKNQVVPTSTLGLQRLQNRERIRKYNCTEGGLKSIIHLRANT